VNQIKYGLLQHSSLNIGDEIQSLAARQFMPRVDCMIYRGQLRLPNGIDGDVKVIVNGWFNHSPDMWPPADNIVPLIISFHINGENMLNEKKTEYFKQYEPIGCRDYSTLRKLKRCGVNAYYSGCLTLTLKRDPSIERSDTTVFCDPFGYDLEGRYYQPGDSLHQDYMNRLFGSKLDVTRCVHVTHRAETGNNDTRSAKAKGLLELYQRAKLVVTSRIHCAVPCLAFGTPVLFIEHKRKRELKHPILYPLARPLLKVFSDQSDERFRGITDLMNRHRLTDLLSRRAELDISAIVSNPVDISDIRASLEEKCTQFING
jgi:hypothetical protein